MRIKAITVSISDNLKAIITQELQVIIKVAARTFQMFAQIISGIIRTVGHQKDERKLVTKFLHKVKTPPNLPEGEELLLEVDVLMGVKTPPGLPEGEELLLGVDVLIGVKTPPGLPEGEELLLGDNILIGVKTPPLRGGQEG